MKRVSTRLSSVAIAASVGLATLVSVGTPAGALVNPAIPGLSLSGLVSSHPWSGGSNASDVEGLGYVPGDNSMWVADDNGDRIYEISSSSGSYKTKIDAVTFQAAQAVGSGTIPAGTLSNPTRTDDLESIIYDPAADVLYVTSGACCNTPAGQPPYNPTVYKLTRQSGKFQPTSWQPLPEGQDATAAGWRPGTGMYLGKGSKIKTYNFATNTIGPDISLPVSSIVGIDFSDANTAFVTTASANTASGRTTADSDSTIHRFNISGSNWTEDLNWKFNLKNTGMIDARDLAIVGDTFWVSDGYDSRPDGDHPIFKYDVGSAVAQFVAAPATGNRPLTVVFTDTSTGAAPLSWAWDFDNNGTVDATTQNTFHVYPNPGNFTAKLTVTYSGGTLSSTQPITVKIPTGAPGGWIVDAWGGLHAVKIGTDPAPPAVNGGPYWVGWDIARGVATLPDNKAGLVLDGRGGLHKFNIGGNSSTVTTTGGPYWQNWDIARGVSILPNGKGGYIVDGSGGIHPFALGNNSLPPRAYDAPYFPGQDRVTGLIIAPDGKGAYTVDRTGKLWPFKFVGGATPAAPNSVALVTAVPMQGGALVADGTGGLTVDGWGGTHGFGVNPNGPPATVTAGPYWVNWNIARDIALLHG